MFQIKLKCHISVDFDFDISMWTLYVHYIDFKFWKIWFWDLKFELKSGRDKLFEANRVIKMTFRGV